jgi:thiosulfate/3-mercaptopyruvate sulfurtransferase
MSNNSMFTEISTDELVALLSSPKAKFIDIRPVDAYNGWQLQNEPRGGHIEGAKTLPAKWANYIDWIEIVRSKGILPEHEIVLYGYSKDKIEEIATRFQKSGYNQIKIYKHFQDEWSPNTELPMDFLPRFENLVPASFVNEIISGERPLEYEGKKVVIVHAHYRNRDAYLSGHIPGAIDMDTLALEATETWNRRSPEELEQALLQHGITSDTLVISYGKFMFPDNDDEFPGSAAGDIGAIRNAFIMMYAGVKDVRVLNGGFQSWEDAAYEIATDDVPKTPVENFGVNIPVKSELAVDVPEAKEMLASSTADLVCVRSWPEYIGEVSGYNYIEKKGRIPGAIFGNCGSDAYHMENYRHVDHTTREFHEVAEIWKQVDITPDKHLAFYCGTGWRGSEAWFNAWLMGWPRVSVFDGGWFEWSNDPENPYETGIPENWNAEIYS